MRYESVDREIEEKIFKLIEENKPGSILDYGCGDGGLLNKISGRFPDIQLTGTDYFSSFGKDFSEKLPKHIQFSR